MPRRALSNVLIVLAALALALSLVSGYAKRAVFNSDQFANRAAAALDDDAVQTQLSTRVTDDLVLKADPDLIGLRPVIQEAISGLIGEPAFQSLFRAAVRDVHAALFKGDKDTVTLTLADVGTLVQGAVQTVDPKAAKEVNGKSSASVLEISPPPALVDAIDAAEGFRPLPWIALALAVALTVAALWISPDRRSTVVQGGTAMAAIGILLLLAYRIIHNEALEMVDDPGERAAAAGIWDAFLDDLHTGLLLFTGAGAVLAAAAASLIRPVDIAGPLRRAVELISEVPETTGRRVLRALLLIAAGVLVIAAREALIDLVVLVLGAYLIYAGLAEILRITTAGPEADDEAQETRRRLVRMAVVAGVAVLMIGGASTAYVAAGGLSEDPSGQSGCNDHEALCDRPLDEVAFAATHNAMSAASDPGWLFANQQNGVGDQLRRGVHALLWDTHYGIKTQFGQVKTDLGDISNVERQEYVEELGEPAVDAALSIRDRLVTGGGKRGIFLCHRFCELGATPLAKGLGQVHDYLVENPSDVAVIVNEDYVKPSDYTDAVKKAGLGDMVYRGATGPWPTLGEMIDSGQRLVMLAEHKGGGDPWYHAAYQGIVQETPYRFKKVSELTNPNNLAATCKPNRGDRDGSLLLLNHWIDTSPAPRPSNAEKVNAYDALLHRARTCQKIRGLLPNLVAVDFYKSGDLFDVVDALNGFAPVTRKK